MGCVYGRVGLIELLFGREFEATGGRYAEDM